MKKPVILIFDPETEKVIQVCAVRDLEPAKFIEFTKIAEKNMKEKMQNAALEKETEKQQRNNEIDNLQRQINELRHLVQHLLGIEELSDEDIAKLLHLNKEEEPNEQN